MEQIDSFDLSIRLTMLARCAKLDLRPSVLTPMEWFLCVLNPDTIHVLFVNSGYRYKSGGAESDDPG
jgi:hypothetical protein